MDILFIIYIFALFVIFSPNFIFQYSKSNNLLVAILHAIIFSIVVYVTYNSVTKTQTEGATIGTYDKNDEISALNVNELNLGGVLNDPSDDKKPKDVQYRNEIVVSSPNTAEEEKIIAMPPYDYSNFRTYDYENMEKKLKMLESHKHTNHYFDLVPNFNETKHEILCAADHDTNKPCCRQPGAVIPESNQCDALKPYCKDYISGTQWGKCVTTNPYPKPNLGYNGQFVSISPEETPIAVVKKPDGTVIIQECPGTKPPDQCEIKIDGACKSYPNMSNKDWFADNDFGGPKPTTLESCKYREQSWETSCSESANISAKYNQQLISNPPEQQDNL